MFNKQLINKCFKKIFDKCFEKSGTLPTEQCKKIKVAGSRPGILYGLFKVHKAIIDICPPFRPILSAIGTLVTNLQNV